MAALGHTDLTAGFTGIPPVAATTTKISPSHRSLLEPVAADAQRLRETQSEAPARANL